MATLDLSKAKFAFSMTDPELVRYAANDGVGVPTGWSYLTTGGDDVLVKGDGMTFDSAGRPTSGTATSIEIDVGNNDPSNPDLVITGINADVSKLDDGPASFWRFLEGNDVILGPELAKGATAATFTLFGDGIAARNGATGGRDIIQTGDGFVQAAGDVTDVGSQTGGAPTANYRGGADELLGVVGNQHQSLSGDAFHVHAGSRLTGGDDSILIQTRYTGSSATGDAYNVAGGARVDGGGDYIAAGKDFGGTLAGDVFILLPQGLVHGGNDEIDAGDLSEVLSGDVHRMTTSELVGGDDTIEGGGGNDIIAGDAYLASADTTVTGGDDWITGGGGNDTIWGDTGGGLIVVEGNDTLYGADGHDRISGNSGNDIVDGGVGSDVLDGGSGDDTIYAGADDDFVDGGAGDDQIDGGARADDMRGYTGDDTYFVNSYGDRITEFAGALYGVDTVWSTLASTVLAANAENLRFNGVGDFVGIGNALANTIAGSAGADKLHGADGNDVLIGGAGMDQHFGGNGVDTASYANASTGVDARLTGNSINFGGDARGDTYDSIENLAGSAFDDNLSGDDFANTLFGDAGGDNLFGFGGDDVLIGGVGDDRLLAKEGNDLLRGGLGADVLRGGAGDDVFDFSTVTESAPGGRDIIAEDVAIAFEGVGIAGGDRIDLSGIDANVTVAGNQAFTFGGVGIGRVSVVSTGTDSLVRCNTDGDAAFELEILIEDAGILATAYKGLDFIL